MEFVSRYVGRGGAVRSRGSEMLVVLLMMLSRVAFVPPRSGMAWLAAAPRNCGPGTEGSSPHCGADSYSHHVTFASLRHLFLCVFYF